MSLVIDRPAPITQPGPQSERPTALSVVQPPCTLIGLCGVAGAGKSTVAARLQNVYGYSQAAFAAPIYDMVRVFLDAAELDPALLDDRSQRELPIDSLGGLSGRQLLQTLGTDWGRQLSDDLWIDLLARSVGLHRTSTCSVSDRLVISDVRFPNEAHWIRAQGGYVVRVERAAPPVRRHVSESHVCSLPIDYVLRNHGDLDDLDDGITRLICIVDRLAADGTLALRRSTGGQV